MTTTTVTEITSVLNDKSRLCVFPIPKNRLRLWDAYKIMRAIGWEPEEARLSERDVHDWENVLTPDERTFMGYILAFFAVSDSLVMSNLVQHFMNEVPALEVQYTWQYQIQQENVHAEVYARFIHKFVRDDKQRKKLFGTIQLLPIVRKKTEWIRRYMGQHSGHNFGVRLFAFAVVEGVLFSGSFCAIDWLRERGLMPGLTSANDFISRDEGHHTDFACLLNAHLAPHERATPEMAKSIMRDAVGVEQDFIQHAMSRDFNGMNRELMCRYIEFVADRLLVQFGYKALYNSKCPFDFMEVKSVRHKENFFEKNTLTNYGKAFTHMSPKDRTFAIIDF